MGVILPLNCLSQSLSQTFWVPIQIVLSTSAVGEGFADVNCFAAQYTTKQHTDLQNLSVSTTDQEVTSWSPQMTFWLHFTGAVLKLFKLLGFLAFHACDGRLRQRNRDLRHPRGRSNRRLLDLLFELIVHFNWWELSFAVNTKFSVNEGPLAKYIE